MTDSSMSSDTGTAGESGPALEFRCQACGKLLRVPGSAAGLSVKCPQCEVVMRAPARGSIEPIGAALTLVLFYHFVMALGAAARSVKARHAG